jgi:transposase
MTEPVKFTKEEAEQYTQSLGQIVAGSWHQVAWAHDQGIPQALGLSTEDWVRERLGGYVRLSLEERREAISELSQNGHSLREIAAIIGVSKDTAARAVSNETPDTDDAVAKVEAKWQKKIAAVQAQYNAQAEQIRKQLASALTTDKLQARIKEALDPLKKRIKEYEEALERSKKRVAIPYASESMAARGALRNLAANLKVPANDVVESVKQLAEVTRQSPEEMIAGDLEAAGNAVAWLRDFIEQGKKLGHSGMRHCHGDEAPTTESAAQPAPISDGLNIISPAVTRAATSKCSFAACGATGEYGYRGPDGAMGWFCAEHRLRQFSSDARRRLDAFMGPFNEADLA